MFQMTFHVGLGKRLILELSETSTSTYKTLVEMLLLEVNRHKNPVVGKKKVFYAKTSNPNKNFIAGETRGKVRTLKRKIKLGKPQLHSTQWTLIIINKYNLVFACLAMDTRAIELLLPPFDRRPFYH